MLTDSNLRSKIDSLWDKLWSGGLSNPLDAIEPLSTDPKLRWSYWSQLPAEKALKHVRDEVFPFLQNLDGKAGSFGEQMVNAQFKINKPSLLIEACRAIEAMEI